MRQENGQSGKLHGPRQRRKHRAFCFHWLYQPDRHLFPGNALPGGGSYVFDGDNNAIVYCLPGTTGWTTFDTGDANRPPLVLWNPQAKNDANFGMRTNQFGFAIAEQPTLSWFMPARTWQIPSGLPWEPPTLTNSSSCFSSYFGDPQWTNYPCRFYGFYWQ